MDNDPTFLDASGWIALLNSVANNHVAAVAIWREIVRRRSVVVVTDWIIAETGNGLARTRHRVAFARAVRLMVASAEVRVISVDGDLLNRALDLYSARADKSWGLVDCASFVVMADLGIREALTGDHHFEQAGFRRLLPGPAA